ncbi:hypothetical protein Tco_1235300 [Tanacetum coccineum]
MTPSKEKSTNRKSEGDDVSQLRVEGDHHEEKVNEKRKINNFTPEFGMTPSKQKSTNRESEGEDKRDTWDHSLGPVSCLESKIEGGDFKKNNGLGWTFPCFLSDLGLVNEDKLQPRKAVRDLNSSNLDSAGEELLHSVTTRITRGRGKETLTLTPPKLPPFKAEYLDDSIPSKGPPSDPIVQSVDINTKVVSPPIVTTSNVVTPTVEKTNDGIQTVGKKKKRKGKSKSINGG